MHCLCLILMSSIRIPCYIHVPWHHPSSLFFQSLGLWPYIMWHVMWPQSHVSFFKKINNLLHGVQWQTVVATSQLRTWGSHASSLSIKKKEKENQKKRNINKRKGKMLVSKCTIIHGQLNFSLRKNLKWYLLIGTWFVIVLVTLVHREFKCPIDFSQVLFSYKWVW